MYQRGHPASLDDPGTYAIPDWELWTLAALFVGSFFFSGTETALTSLGEAKARQLRDRLGDRGRALGLWIEHPHKVLTALLIGNNLVNVAASAVATAVALSLFGSAALAVVTGVMTLLLLIFGEITPKTIARENAERWAVPALRILRPFYLLTFPLAWLLARLSSRISRLFGEVEERPLVTSEDVDWVIGLSAREGALEEVKEQLLTSVLEFTDLLVKEIMVDRTHVVALDVRSEPQAALDLTEKTGHSRYPVFDGTMDEIVGVLSVKDLLPALRGGAETLEGRGRLSELRPFVRQPLFVPELMKVSRLLKEMQRRRTHMAVVVDEFGGTSGVVTLEDIVEEIVGEIRDEHDIEEQAVVRLPDGRILAEAAVPLRDLEDALDQGLDFPDEGDYESLGGFLIAMAGRVPPVGERVGFGGYDFTVRAADAKRVLRVEIAKAPRPEPGLEVVEGGAASGAASQEDGRGGSGSASAG